MRKPPVPPASLRLDDDPAQAYAGSNYGRPPMTAQPELRPLGQALGSEALGIDLARLDDGGFAWIERAFAEHPVLVFREQSLAAAELAVFGRRFARQRPHS